MNRPGFASKLVAPRVLAVAWALLVALGLVQLAVAGHWSAHTLAAADDHCAVCAQLDRLDQGLGAECVPQPIPVLDPQDAIESGQSETRPPLRSFAARAPPARIC